MKDHRQGNDLAVLWSIFKDGEPFDLRGRSLKLYLKNLHERKEVVDFSVTGNEIHWTFYGKDQDTLGKHTLTLVVNEGEKGMITTDTCDFVRLVSCSCKLQGGEDAPNVETESIELTSTLEYVAGGMSEEEVLNLLDGKVDKEEGKGLSTNDYTDEDRAKLAGLENYDDSGIKGELAKKAEKSEIPTKMSQLEQDIEIGGEVDLSDYPTREEVSETYLPREEFNEVSERFASADRVQELSENVTELSAEVSGLSEGIALRNVGAEDTDESVDEPSIPSNGMTTPSGDPMHYMFEAVGATYNATDADIPMVGVCGDSYVHKARHWHLNELGDITNEEMRVIYNERYPIPSAKYIPEWFREAKARTTLSALSQSVAFVLNNTCRAAQCETFALLADNAEMQTSQINEAFYDCAKLRKILNVLNFYSVTSISAPFGKCNELEHLRIRYLKINMDFKYNEKISKFSILYMIENEAATSAITIRLSNALYDSYMADADIQAALAAHPNISLAK